jgi:hypothetical protein
MSVKRITLNPGIIFKKIAVYRGHGKLKPD